ncbi:MULTISPECIES: DNA polymerase III subunit delta [Terrabacteria group]|uniref:DNA polymerase III subunit delta n=1 Tax=Bacillati TaxID=1783272 RepID=UPI001C6E68F3|nr:MULTISPECIES: DNA polymerase III subunit delta [Terrabacteria group]MBW9211841.1 DNA polymerase III subunit delta [Trueperella sp. zg.1013]
MNSVYLISGDDRYRKEEYLSFLKQTKEIETSEIEIFDASKVKNFSMPLFFHSLASQSLFDMGKRMVILKDAYFLSTSTTKGNEKDLDYFQKEMVLYLKDPNEQIVLVIYMDEVNLDARKKLVKFLKKENIEQKTFTALKPWEFPTYAKQRLQQEKLSLNQAAFDELILRVQNDSLLLQRAVEKLKLIPKDCYDLKDIEELVSYSPEVDVYALGNVFLEGDFKKTWKILKRFQAAGVDTQAQIALLASRLRHLYDMKELRELGYDEMTIATRLRVKPYAIQKGLEACSSCSALSLLKFLKELADLDQEIKIGKIDAKQGFEYFILRNGRTYASN